MHAVLTHLLLAASTVFSDLRGRLLLVGCGVVDPEGVLCDCCLDVVEEVKAEGGLISSSSVPSLTIASMGGAWDVAVTVI